MTALQVNYKALSPPAYELCARCTCLRPPRELMPWQDQKFVCSDTESCTKAVEALTGTHPVEEPKP